MPVYRYTAAPTPGPGPGSGLGSRSGADATPRITRGQLAADSEQPLRAALRSMGLQPLTIRPRKPQKPRNPRPRNPRLQSAWRLRANPAVSAQAENSGCGAPSVVSSGDGLSSAGRFAFVESLLRRRHAATLVEFYESLATLLSSGAPLAGSLDLLGTSVRRDRGLSGLSALLARLRGSAAERAIATACLSLAERVRGGASLAEAMAEQPSWFGPVDCALVSSCERSGHAERALADLADLHARGEDLRGKLAGALAYPALLLIFGLGVVVFLTTTTLPQLAGVLADAGAALPPATAALLALGELLTTRWPLALLLVIAVIAGAGYLARSDRFARARLAMPLLGRASLRGQTSSAAILLARLLDAGVPLAEAIELVAPSVPNSALRGEFLALRESLLAGRSLSERAASGGLIEPVFCRVLEVAEESGEMASALRTIGNRQRESARRLIDRLAGILEPVVILMLACGIGFVVYAAIAPMLRVAQSL